MNVFLYSVKLLMYTFLLEITVSFSYIFADF
jgi:hypothetical protein